MAAELSIKPLCSQASLNSETHCICLNIKLCTFVFYDPRHWQDIAKLFLSTALSTGYFVDVSLAI